MVLAALSFLIFYTHYWISGAKYWKVNVAYIVYTSAGVLTSIFGWFALKSKLVIKVVSKNYTEKSKLNLLTYLANEYLAQTKNKKEYCFKGVLEIVVS